MTVGWILQLTNLVHEKAWHHIGGHVEFNHIAVLGVEAVKQVNIVRVQILAANFNFIVWVSIVCDTIWQVCPNSGA
jgi:hypothetical protein